MLHRIAAGLVVLLTLACVGLRADAGPVGAEFRVNTYIDDQQTLSSVANLTDGGFVVAWTSMGQGGAVMAQRYNAAGARVGSEFRVNTNPTGNKWSAGVVSVAGLADGGFVIAWLAKTNVNIYAQRFNSAGLPAGGEFRVSNFVPNHARFEPSVAGLTDGGFVIVWQGENGDSYEYNIYAQRYRNTGEPVGRVFTVNTQTDSEQYYPSVTGLSNGHFVVVWMSYSSAYEGSQIRGQRYSASAVPIGPEFKVNTGVSNSPYIPSVAGLAGTGFVVAWQTYGPDGSENGIYARCYSAWFECTGSEIRVNSFTAKDQSDVSVAGLADGGFVVTWSSEDQDGSGRGIYAQRYSSTRTPIGGEVRVNSYISDDQTYPSVVGLTNGGFVVTWDSNGQDGFENGIYGQLYSP